MAGNRLAGTSRSAFGISHSTATDRVLLAASLLVALAPAIGVGQGRSRHRRLRQAGARFDAPPDGKPDLTGYYMPDAGGANYGLERHDQDFLTPAGRGIIVDPPDGKLPLQAWARAERRSRACLSAGTTIRPRTVSSPGCRDRCMSRRRFRFSSRRATSSCCHERMSWRTIPLDGRPHIADTIRLWQGDSVGRWEGDTLVVETKNLNGKTWLNEVGEIVSHAETVVERFIPVDADNITYRATVTDPLVYTRPWTIEVPLNRQQDELLEVACHEDNQDLQHLKEVRDAARAQRAKEK